MFLPTVILLVAVHLSDAFFETECVSHNSAIGRVKGNGAGRVDDVLTVEDCRMHCQMTDECNAFIWNDEEHPKNPNVCWMKKGFTEKGLADAEHRHSGAKVYLDILDIVGLWFLLVSFKHSILTSSYIHQPHSLIYL